MLCCNDIYCCRDTATGPGVMGRAEASAAAEWLADHVVKCQFEAAILDREMDGKREGEK
jgi:hypothetical protein